MYRPYGSTGSYTDVFMQLSSSSGSWVTQELNINLPTTGIDNIAEFHFGALANPIFGTGYNILVQSIALIENPD